MRNFILNNAGHMFAPTTRTQYNLFPTLSSAPIIKSGQKERATFADEGLLVQILSQIIYFSEKIFSTFRHA